MAFRELEEPRLIIPSRIGPPEPVHAIVTQHPGGRNIAIVHDWCPVFRGAERVLTELCKVFRGADIFTVFDFLPAEIKEA
jgi:hypothetical protein